MFNSITLAQWHCVQFPASMKLNSNVRFLTIIHCTDQCHPKTNTLYMYLLRLHSIPNTFSFDVQIMADEDLSQYLKFEFSDFLDDVELIPTQQLLFTKTETNERHAAPVSSDDLRQKFLDSVPKKTREKNKWAVSVWRDWAISRNSKAETYFENPEQFPIPVELSLAEVNKLNYWMARFITEVRRKDGTDYPPNTLTQITAGLQRHLREECDRPGINLLKKDDTTFDLFRKSLDARMKELTNRGVGVKVKRADPVLKSDEEKMWSTGVLNMDSSTGLSNCVFFYNCKLFAFRANDEHRNLEASQFDIVFDHESRSRCLEFTGRSSKNVQGGLKHRTVSTKQIRHYEQKENPRCVVKIYEKYLGLIPAIGPFYRRPIESTGSPKFSSQPIGEKKLSCMMKYLFSEAGIDTGDRNITNHSGKVGCCTTLFNEGFDDKMVRSRSGHRSNALDIYKRPLKQIEQSVSNALNVPMPEMDKENHSVKEEISECKFPMAKAVSETSAKQPVTDQNSITFTVPDEITTVVIIKNGNKILLSL